MGISKKMFVFTVSFLIVLSLSVEAKAEKKVGILIFSEEARYKEATTGFMEKLKEEGFTEPKIKIIIENAGANKARAAELVKKYSAEKMDLIFTLGTSMTIPVAREIKDIPIVFGIVYDPVEAGITKSWKSSGNNTTGASTRIPMQKMIDVLKEFMPVKRLGSALHAR